MSNALRREILDAIERGASLEDFAGILRKHRDEGVSAQAAAGVLEAMRPGTDERIEDSILEVLDIVYGWCRPDLRVWSDP